MSRENVEVVLSLYEAFNRGELAASQKALHPAAELHQTPTAPDAGTYRGRDEFARGLALWLSEWDDPRYEPLDVQPAGEHVILRVRVWGRGKASGIMASTEFFHAWTLRDGQPFQCFVRSTRDEALKAVGLEA